MMQNILTASENYGGLDEYFRSTGAKKILLVCDNSIGFLKLNDYFNTLEERLDIKVVRFGDFEPNPKYESVVKGVELFHSENCELIAVVGGGSAIDVTKCIKLYSNMDSRENYLKQEIIPVFEGLIQKQGYSFAKPDDDVIREAVKEAADAVEAILSDGIDIAMNHFNVKHEE